MSDERIKEIRERIYKVSTSERPKATAHRKSVDDLWKEATIIRQTFSEDNSAQRTDELQRK